MKNLVKMRLGTKRMSAFVLAFAMVFSLITGVYTAPIARADGEPVTGSDDSAVSAAVSFIGDGTVINIAEDAEDTGVRVSMTNATFTESAAFEEGATDNGNFSFSGLSSGALKNAGVIIRKIEVEEDEDDDGKISSVVVVLGVKNGKYPSEAVEATSLGTLTIKKDVINTAADDEEATAPTGDVTVETNITVSVAAAVEDENDEEEQEDSGFWAKFSDGTIWTDEFIPSWKLGDIKTVTFYVGNEKVTALENIEFYKETGNQSSSKITPNAEDSAVKAEKSGDAFKIKFGASLIDAKKSGLKDALTDEEGTYIITYKASDADGDVERLCTKVNLSASYGALSANNGSEYIAPDITKGTIVGEGNVGEYKVGDVAYWYVRGWLWSEGMFKGDDDEPIDVAKIWLDEANASKFTVYEEKVDENGEKYAGGDPSNGITISYDAAVNNVAGDIRKVDGEDVTLSIYTVKFNKAGTYYILYDKDTRFNDYWMEVRVTEKTSSGGGSQTPVVTARPVSTPAPTAEPSIEPSAEPSTEPAPTAQPTAATQIVVPSEAPSDLTADVTEVVAPTAAPVGTPLVESAVEQDGSSKETITTQYADGSALTEEKTVAASGAVTEKKTIVAADGAVASSEVTKNADGSTVAKSESVSADGKEKESKEVVTDASGAAVITKLNEKTEGVVITTEGVSQSVDAAGKVSETVQKSTVENTETGAKTEKEFVWDASGALESAKQVETAKVGTSVVVDMVVVNSDGSGLISTETTQANGDYSSEKTSTTASGKVSVELETKKGSKKTKTVFDENSTKTGAVTIKSHSSQDKTLTVPNSIDANGETRKVTAIGAGAFKGNKTINKASVGDNVKTVGKNAFKGDTKLAKVDLGKNTKTIGAGAFAGDKKLKTVTIKTGKVTTVGKNAFKGIAKNATIKIDANKTDYKKLVKKIEKSGGLPKGVKFKRI